MTKTKSNPSHWKRGQSGNPSGRPPGTTNTQHLRALIAEDLPQVLLTVSRAALAGDMAACKLILDRVLPPRKPTEEPIELDLPLDGSLTDKAKAVIMAVGRGGLAPSQASQLLTGLAAVGKIRELEELEARIVALEERANQKS